MKNYIVLFILSPLLSFAQISKSGYQQYKWGQSQATTKNIANCNTKFSGTDFSNCDYIVSDSLFLNKYKFIFCNFRFYQNKLSEIQFDIRHKDLANLIAELTTSFGSPVVKEKKHQALDIENQSTGYIWNVGDTQIFVINDGKKVPAICILSSMQIRNTYPANTLTLDKLIFE